ncbi:MAG: ADOP family duplicated permease [Gemmatimonadaceae bacterium]
MRRVFRIPFFGGGQIRREVDDELAFHLAMRAERLAAAGMSPEDAQREALRQFGDLGGVREDCVTMDEARAKTMRRTNVVQDLRQDIGFALRSLERNAGFASVVIGALALGIGANTSIFTLIDATLVRTLPVRNPTALVAIGNTARVNSSSDGAPRTDLFSYPLYRDLRDNNHVFTGVFASGTANRIDARIGGAAAELEHPRGRYVSANYFSVLGVTASRGRVFDGTEDNTLGASPVVVISDGYWTRRFHNDPSVVGSTISIAGTRLTIIGVTPPSFTGEIVGVAYDLWIPVSMHDALRTPPASLDNRTRNWLLLMGRLEPGAALEQARAEIPSLTKRFIVANAKDASRRAFLAGDQTYYVASGSKGFSRIRQTFQTPLVTLMIGVALLLCIICANVANLLLARSLARGREMAVRLALGASRARLVRQLLTEGVVLAGLGAAAGLLLAWWGSRMLLTLAAGGGAVSLDLGLDLAVLTFTLVVSLGAVVLFGLAPALRAASVDLASTIRAGATSIAGGTLAARGQRAPLGQLLIAGQVALSVVLLIGAAMLVRSLRNVVNVGLGLDHSHLLIADIDVASRGLQWERLSAAARAVHDRIAAIPGVAAVGYSENGVFSGTESDSRLELPGFVARSASDTVFAYDQVSTDYARAIGARIVDGRGLDAGDEGGLARTVVVNEAFASFYFPGGSAVGKYFHVSDSVTIHIVGVMSDVRDHDMLDPAARRAYFTYNHHDVQQGTPETLSLEVRTTGDPAALVNQVRQAIVATDPNLPIRSIAPLERLMMASISEQRVVAQLATAFGVLALLLAGVGLYGVMTYAVVRRTGEIGVRVALGAQQADVVRMILFDALRLVAAGLAVGVPLALASTRLLGAQLHGVQAVDPISIATALTVLTASALVAGLLPALRASRVSPIQALRAE